MKSTTKLSRRFFAGGVVLFLILALSGKIAAQAAPPTITSFSPASGSIGASVTITGTNFSTTLANNIVYFGAVRATVTSATSTSLSVTVPTGATYAPITVTVNGLTAYSQAPFIVTFSGGGSITASSFASKVDFNVGIMPHSVAVGDLDTDGKIDIVVTNNLANTISILGNTSSNGSISFATKIDLSTALLQPRELAVGDIDGDGKLDIIVSYLFGSVISVYRNTSTPGSISLASNADFTVGSQPKGIAIGDIDGDGKPDLVVANNGTNSVSVLRNTSTTGSISFATKVDFTVGTSPYSVAIGDVDGDGKPDLAVSNEGENTVSVLANTSSTGNISFATKVDFAVGPQPRGVVIGDIDGDGKPDVAVANNFFITVSVLRNLSSSGTISFATKLDFFTLGNPNGVAVGDLDGDAKVDFAVPNQAENKVSLLRNTSSSGNILFASSVDFVTATQPYGMGAVGDVDGDGKPDVIVANSVNIAGGNTVSVLRNTVLNVTNTNDSGPGSLRQAIMDANATAGKDTIVFNISGTGPHTIAPTSLLPTVTDPVIIDGTTQPGFGGTPIVELNGSNAGATSNGLLITAGSSTIRGLVINRFNGDGIRIETNGGNVIEANYIGTDVTGSTILSNGGSGVIVSSSGNTIGGTAEGAGNVISGNGFVGILIEVGATGNQIEGNLVGTDVTGTADLGNTFGGIGINIAANNTIGGTAPGARNLISGNDANGIFVSGSGAVGNLIQGNYIGTDITGTVPLSNAFAGVNVSEGMNNVIGGTSVGARNVISGNAGSGVNIGFGAAGNAVKGNLIGTDASGIYPLANGFAGVSIDGAPNNIVGGTTPEERNIISGNNAYGVIITGGGASENLVQGNLIGTSVNGTTALGNSSFGVIILDGASSNTIGGTAVGAGNVISGNGQSGVSIQGVTTTGNLVQGNYIGTDLTGNAALGNAFFGVFIHSAVANTVGGTEAGARNIISGNGEGGVQISGFGGFFATGNLVRGNYIGTNATGSAAVGNSSFGVIIRDEASNNTIGGTETGARNVVSGNQVGMQIEGVAAGNLIQGNFIGTQSDGTTPLGNTLYGISVLLAASGNTIGVMGSGSGNIVAFNGGHGVRVLSGTGNSIFSNSIFSNSGLGIDLGSDGVTPNDAGDGDTGPNDLQNFPVLISADNGSTTIEGTLNGIPNTSFRLEFFSNTACDLSDHGEGENFLGSVDVTTDSGGDVSFTATFSTTVPAGNFITATATDPNNNTSEFSKCFEVNNAPVANAQSVLTDEDTPKAIALTGSDVDGDPLTFVIVSGPTNGSLFGLNSATGAVTYTPNLNFSGSDSLIFNVNDGKLNSPPATVGITVNPLNDAPEITSTPVLDATQDQMYQYQVEATDPEGDSLTYSFTVAPAFLSVDNSTGLISGTPRNADVGEHLVTVEARDTLGGIGTQSYTLEVANVNDAPMFFSLLEPAGRDTLDLVFPPVPVLFRWFSSSDPDVEDTVRYAFRLTGAKLDTTVTELEDTTLSFGVMSQLQVATTYQWYVVATDGELTTSSDTLEFRTSESVVSVQGTEEIPETYALYQNYPNPFNPTTTIRYELPKHAKVSLRVYDLLGREVEALVDEEQEPGRYEVVWYLTEVSSGIYFYRLQAGEFIEVKRLIFLK